MDLKDRKVLLVEDDVLLAGLLGEKLAESFTVSRAGTGEEALALAQKEHPSLILLDILLPGMDGFEVLKKLKENAETKNIPVIVLTNLSAKADMDKAKELGAVEFVVKISLSPDEVVTLIEQILSGKKS